MPIEEVEILEIFGRWIISSKTTEKLSAGLVTSRNYMRRLVRGQLVRVIQLSARRDLYWSMQERIVCVAHPIGKAAAHLCQDRGKSWIIDLVAGLVGIEDQVIELLLSDRAIFPA